jgi:hypothetical protein
MNDETPARNRFSYPWDQEKRNLCLYLREQGYTAEEIAVELNAQFPNTDPLGKPATRDAVLGQLHRLMPRSHRHHPDNDRS